MKSLLKAVLVAVFSLTAVAAFANTEGKEKGNSSKETTVSDTNAPAPAPVPAPAPSTGGCGCGKPKTK